MRPIARYVLPQGKLPAAERGQDQPGGEPLPAASAPAEQAPGDQQDAQQDHELAEREAAPGSRRALVDPGPAGAPAWTWARAGDAARATGRVALGPSARGGLDGALAATPAHRGSRTSGMSGG